MIWRFGIYLFCEILKFCENMNNLRNVVKSVFAHIFLKFRYIAKKIIYLESQDHML